MVSPRRRQMLGRSAEREDVDAGEPTIATAPGQAPEAKVADREARDRGLDAITGSSLAEPCGRCSQRHVATFYWRGVERKYCEPRPG